MCWNHEFFSFVFLLAGKVEVFMFVAALAVLRAITQDTRKRRLIFNKERRISKSRCDYH